jgi:tetratricopeptide (TPR) repeat protein
VPPAAGPQIDDAVRALDAGRAADARPHLEKSVAARPGDAYVWALLARTYWTLKDPAKAKTAADRAESGVKASPEAQHALALYYAQSGNRKRAALLEGWYAASGKADSNATIRAAMLYFETGGYADAIRFGAPAADRPEIALLLARSYEALKQPAQAIAAYESLPRLRPYDEESHSQLAQAYLRAGRFNDAVEKLEASVRTFDKSPQLELALGVAYYGQRRFADAGKRFLRVIDLAPEIEQPYVFLAKMIDQLEAMLPEIRAKFAAWNQAEKRNHYAPFVYSKVAPPEEVEGLLREAIRRQPAFWESHADLAAILERRRDFAGAARELEESAKLSPEEPSVQYRLSRVYARLGQGEKSAAARARHEKLSAAAGAKAGMTAP